MSQEAVERVLGRLLTETWFRLRVADSLEAVSLQEGYQLNATELRMLEGVDPSHVARFADRLDSGLCRAAGMDVEKNQWPNVRWPAYQTRFLQILSNYPGLISLTLAGHAHIRLDGQKQGTVATALRGCHQSAQDSFSDLFYRQYTSRPQGFPLWPAPADVPGTIFPRWDRRMSPALAHGLAISLIRIGKLKFAWVTAGPGLFMLPICMWAGYLNITRNFLPQKLYLLAGLSLILMVLMTIVFVEAFRRWYALMLIDKAVTGQLPANEEC